MLLIVWNSLIFEYYVDECCNYVKMAPVSAASHARSRDRNGMNGGKVSLFHVFQANVLTLHDVKSGNRGFRVTSMLFADSTVHDA
jgi:hypothetical protein